MRAIALRGLAERKLRSALTAIAVLLGVAMISGTYVFTDTINSTFDQVFETANEGVDVVISGRSEFDTDAGPVTKEIPESLVDRVKDVPGVETAAGNVEDFASIIKENGDQVETLGAPPLLFSRPPERFDPLEYVEGEPPASPTEVAINKGTADDENLKIGDKIFLAGRSERQEFTISGLATFGDVESLGGATVSVVTLPRAQALADQPGRVDSIQAAADRDVTAQELVVRLERVQHLFERPGDLLHLGLLLGRQVVQVLVHRLRRLDLVLDPVEARHQHRAEGEVGVRGGVGRPELQTLRRRLA